MKPTILATLLVLIFSCVVFADGDVLGTIYIGLELGSSSAGVGTEVRLGARIDSIKTIDDSTVYSAGPCFQEYQTFCLHSLSGRPLVDLDIDSISFCTGSPCYRSYYTHSSPFDLNRELIAWACYFLVADSLDSVYSFLDNEYDFLIKVYRPGNTEISLTERFITDDLDEWIVVSDTVVLNSVGAPMDCVPLKAPKCGEVWDITPVSAKGIWHHVTLHNGYQYRINTSPSPPSSGHDIDTNYVSISGLLPETSYYLHIRAWANCETSGRSYSPWTSVPFNTLPQPLTTVKTAREDLYFIADSTLYDTTTVFNWPYEGESGPCHWLEAVSPQFGEPGPIYYFKSWSDGGGFYHCHRVEPINTSITCNYDSIDADFVSQLAPDTICSGASVPVAITMLNSGSLSWRIVDGISLRPQNPPGSDTWGIDSVSIDSSSVDIGSEYSFDFTITAPDIAGDYVFEWELHYAGLGYFGEHSESTLITVVEAPIAEASNDGPYCEEEIVQFVGGPDGMISYEWSGPGGFSTGAQSPYLAEGDPDMSGTYTLVVINGDGCIDSVDMVLVVNPKPVASATNDGPYCSGQAINLSGNPPSMGSYSWTGPGGFTSINRFPVIPNAEVSDTGFYRLIVTSLPGCVDTDSTYITVYERPVIEGFSNSPICENDTLMLWAMPSELDSFFWLFPDASIRPGRIHSIPYATAGMSGMYRVVGTSDDGCADTSTLIVTIDSTLKTLEIDSVTADSASIFMGGSTFLHCYISGAAGPLGYSWFPSSSLVWPDSSDPLAGPSETTKYYVVVTDTQECGTYSVIDSILITVWSEFSCLLYLDSLTHDTAICRGSSVPLYADADLEAGSVSYLWFPPDWLTSYTVPNPVATPETSMVYTVTAIDDSGCVDSGQVSIRVSDLDVSIDIDSARICRGDTILLSVIVSGGIEPFEYLWTPAFIFDHSDSSSVLAGPETTSVISLYMVDSSGCIAADSVVIRVDTAITILSVDAYADDSSIVIGESVQLHAGAFGFAGVSGYEWSPVAYLDSPFSPNPWAYPDVSTWFRITVTDSQTVCVYELVDSIYIEVEDTSSCPLVISDISPHSTICRGDSIGLWVVVEGMTGPIEYSWSPEEFLSNSGIRDPIAYPTVDTRFTVVVSDDSCRDSGYVDIDVDSVIRTMEIVDAWASPETIDIGDSTRLFSLVSGDVGDLSVQWTPSGALSDPDSIGTFAYPIVPTTYTFIASDSQNCGIHYDSATVFVHVNTWLGCSLSVESYGGDSICPGETAILSAHSEGGVGDVNYAWTPIEGLSTPYSPVTDASPETTTTYTVTATDDSSCTNQSSVIVHVKWIDDSGLPELRICRAESLALTLSVENCVAPINWRWAPPIFLDDPDSPDPLCYPDTSMEYMVTAVDAEGCSLEALVAIEVDSVIRTMSINLSPDTSIATGGTAHLRAGITGSFGSVGFSWSPISWLDDPSSMTPDAEPPYRTVYIFSAIDTQECGLYSVSDSVVVDILPEFECSLDINTLFTDTAICRGNWITLETSVSGITGSVNYNWSPTTWLSDPHSPNPIASGIDSSITYMVIATDDSCADTATVNIRLKEIALAVSDSFRICRGETISLGALMPDGTEPLNWSWFPTGFLSNPDSNFTLAYPYDNTTFRVIAEDYVGCFDTAEIEVIIDTVLTTMRLSVLASPLSILPGDSVLLSVIINDNGGPVGILWRGLSPIEDSTEATSWAYPADSTWFVVTVSDSQECGVHSLSDSVFIAVVSNICSLDVTTSSGDTICSGDTTTIYALFDNNIGPVELIWRPAESLDDSTSATPHASPENTTIYTVTGIDSVGCMDSSTVIITVRENPLATAIAEEDTIYIGDDIHLLGFPQNDEYDYFWSGPDGFADSVRCPIIAEADTQNSGEYILMVSNEYGCEGLDTVSVMVIENPCYPEIEVSPLWLDFTLIEPDSADSDLVVINNLGDTTLEISSIELFLEIGNFGFSTGDTPIHIVPGRSDSITVFFSGDISGVYKDTLGIESSDSAHPLVKVSLFGEIIESSTPSIATAPETLDFGSIYTEDCVRESTNISNNGQSNLMIFQVDTYHPELSFLRPSLPDTLGPSANEYYVFEYCPVLAGSLQTWIGIWNNDPENPTYLLLALGLGLSAEGYSTNTDVISPNGDGKNDILRFEIPETVIDWEVAIYNNRGRRVLFGKLDSWDGTDRGEKAPIGTYYYKLTVDGELKLSGSFSVIY